MRLASALTLALVPLAGALGLQVPESRPAPVPELHWADCGGGFECATATVPMDHDRPRGETIELALIRRPAPDPAQRLGTLFVNPGGPGGSGVSFLRDAPLPAFDLLARFDVVSWDPRGVGASVPAVDCGTPPPEGPVELHRPDTVDPAQLVADAEAFITACVEGSGEILAHLSSANSARDLDLLRHAVGDERLNYIGASYGSMIGAAYATLFPGNTGAIVLDSPVDVEEHIEHPFEVAVEQLTGFENTLDRLFASCAAAGARCPLGTDPEMTFDEILEQLDRDPLETNDPDHPFPVTGDEVRLHAVDATYNPGTWAALAHAVAAAGAGDPAPIVAFGNDTRDSLVAGVGVTIQYADMRFSRRIDDYLDFGRRAYRLFDHFWLGTGYADVSAALWPVRDRDALRGEVEHAADALPILVVGATYDPATPYHAAQELTADLGNARLLTFRGDGHTALISFDPCLWGATLDYLYGGVLPAEGTTCVDQRRPFG